jgi:carbon storage regulator
VLGRGTHKTSENAVGNARHPNQGRLKMLVLSRKVGEKIVIGDNLIVEVLKVQGNRVTLGLVAPVNVPIMRSELIKNSTAKPVSSLVVEDGLLVAG